MSGKKVSNKLTIFLVILTGTMALLFFMFVAQSPDYIRVCEALCRSQSQNFTRYSGACICSDCRQFDFEGKWMVCRETTFDIKQVK